MHFSTQPHQKEGQLYAEEEQSWLSIRPLMDILHQHTSEGISIEFALGFCGFPEGI